MKLSCLFKPKLQSFVLIGLFLLLTQAATAFSPTITATHSLSNKQFSSMKGNPAIAGVVFGGTNLMKVTSTATFTQTAPTCTGATANNNGISTAGAATYDSPAYPATTFRAVGQNVSTTIPNTGGTYSIRFFNGNNVSFIYPINSITVSLNAKI